MHPGIKLFHRRSVSLKSGHSENLNTTHHDGLPLVLNNMTRTSDLIATTQAIEDELIRRVDGLIVDGGRHRRRLALCRHGKLGSLGR